MLLSLYLLYIIKESNKQRPDPASVREFVENNFNPEGTEFEDWNPQDWKETIPVYKTIKVKHIFVISRILIFDCNQFLLNLK